MTAEGLSGEYGWIWSALIALFVAVGTVVTDLLVRWRRSVFLADLTHRLGLLGADEFTEELDQITRSPNLILFSIPVALFAGISAIGLNYALFPSENAPFLQHNIFVLSAQFGKPGQTMDYQRQAVTALFAGFIGAYAFCLYRLYEDIRAGRFSPGALVLASGTLIAASVATVVLWHGIAAIGAGTLVSFSSSTLFVVSVIAGFAIARPGPLLLQQAWARLWEWGSPVRAVRALNLIDGLNFRARRQLMLFRITDVQNLATASPLLLATATEFGLPEIIDWIGQARMVLRVGDRAQVNSLRACGVRNIFHLVDAASDKGTASELGRALQASARAPTAEASEQLAADDSQTDSGAALILRIADSERADPQFQRLEAIRGATGPAESKPPAPPTPSVVPAKFAVVRAPQVTMQRWTEHGTDETVTKLDFTVDLVGEPGEAADSGQWATLPVKVRLFSPAVEFDDEEAIVLVRYGDASVPCRIVGTLRSEEVQIKVRALFYVGARFSGALVKTFPVVAAVGADVVEPAMDERRRPSVLAFSDRQPDLTVTITIPDEYKPSIQMWYLDSAMLTRANGYTHSRQSKPVAVNDPAGFFAKYHDILATKDPAQLKNLLHSLGRELFDKTPDCFKEAYWFLRERDPDFSIQFMTDDGQTPVELMVPYRLREELDLLSTMHPMARWTLPRYEQGLGGDRAPSIPRGMVAAMAPDYSPSDCVAAIPNLSAIRQYYKEHNIRWFDGVASELISLLNANYPVRILVFYGHGKAGTKGSDSYLVMADRNYVVREIDNASTTLGQKYQTLVVLNACSTGGGALGSVSEWPTTLIKWWFGGIVAPLWDVDTFQAHNVSMVLLNDILEKHRRISESLRDQKAHAFASGGFPAALAYVFHGDVMARVE